MLKRIFLLVGLCIIAFVEIQKIFPRAQTRVEVPREATTTGKIIAGEMATVATVIDGDTFELTDGRRVRYIGIDAPEYDACYGQNAKEENRRLVSDATVRLEKDVSDVDSYGRILRYVYIGDTMINTLLVRNGFARVWLVAPDEKETDAFLAAQSEARQMSRGLWQACRK